MIWQGCVLDEIIRKKEGSGLFQSPLRACQGKERLRKSVSHVQEQTVFLPEAKNRAPNEHKSEINMKL
jgi:hypothetical protein